MSALVLTISQPLINQTAIVGHKCIGKPQATEFEKESFLASKSVFKKAAHSFPLEILMKARNPSPLACIALISRPLKAGKHISW